MKTFTLLSLFIFTSLIAYSQTEPENSKDTLVGEFDETNVFWSVPTAQRKIKSKLILETDRLRNVVFKEKHNYSNETIDDEHQWESYTLKSYDSVLYSYFVVAGEWEYSYNILVNKKNNKKTNLIGEYVISPKKDFFVSHRGTGMDEGGIEIFSISNYDYEMVFEATLDLLGETNINWISDTSFEIIVSSYEESKVVSKITFTLKEGKWIQS
ncbi:MAG: hypothetical protein RI922_2352 [Bacteroidota bacterium]|jgi:hypothetical protein